MLYPSIRWLQRRYARSSRTEYCCFGTNAAHSKLFENAYEATKDIPSNSTVLVGGFGICGTPNDLIKALNSRNDVHSLTVVSNNCGLDDWGNGMLLLSNKVKRMVSSYVGDNEYFAKRYLSGHLELELVPQGTLAERLRCGGSGIPAFYTATGVGTLFQEGGFAIKYKPNSKEGEIISKPKEYRVFNGRTFVLEEAIKGDFALIKAWRSDKRGNLQFKETGMNFNPMCAMAAKTCIAEVEDIVECGEIDPHHVHLPGIYVHRIVKWTNYEKIIEKRVFSLNETMKEINQREVHQSAKDRISRRAAAEFYDGMNSNLGIGIPILATEHIPMGMNIMIQSENGLLGMGPHPIEGQESADLINAGKETVTMVKGASIFSSADSFAMIRGGHMDLTILGAMEVSRTGDLANWIIPGKMVKGPGGAIDLVSSGSRVVVAMEHVSKKGEPKIVEHCSLPLTGRACIDRIITDLCVFDVCRGKGLVLIEIADGITLDMIQKVTACEFEVSPILKPMKQL